MTFPTTLEDVSDPGTGTLAAENHRQHHIDVQNLAERIQAKVGIDGSGVTSSLDYLIKSLAGGHHHDGVDSRTVAHSDLSGLTAGNPHTQYAQKSLLSAKGSVLGATAAATPADVPVGTNGQVLTADSAQALGIKWATPTVASVATDTLFDAKGDIVAATAADTATRLAVGSNGQVLTAQSGQATGLLWATLPTLATDPLFDAKGDIIAGTGADAAARVAVGTNGLFLQADSSQAAGVKWASAAGSGAVATDGIFDAKGDLPVGTANDAASRLAVGTNGQVLTADSSQATGVKWAAGPASTIISDTLFDAKGDMAVGTGADASAKLTVGSNGQVLTADSAQTTGTKWATPLTVATDTIFDTKGDIVVATAADTASKLAVGSNGQVLTADSAQGTGIKWAAVPASSVATDTIIDAKGDLIGGTGADAAARLAVGTNGQFLTAQSGQSTGLQWATHDSTGDPHTQYATDGDLTTHAAAADPHTGYLLESLFDAKGDIIAATADNTPSKLTVGTNGQVLTADSASGPGVKWATPAASSIAADTLWAAKGDLAVATADNVAGILGVGADNRLLVADSTAGKGIRWAVLDDVMHGTLGEDLHHDKIHNYAMHTDTARSVFFVKDDGTGVSATATTKGSGATSIQMWGCADGADQGARFQVPVPPDFASGSGLSIRVVWAPEVTDAVAHTVGWEVTQLSIIAGTDITAAGTTTHWAGDSAARTANIAVVESAHALTAPVIGDDIRFVLRRLGLTQNNLEDTYVGQVNILGFWLDYTAQQ